MTTRRDFLWNTTLATSAMAVASERTASATPAPQPWFDRPMRWAQLTMVEDDPGKYAVNFWLNYFRRTHSDAACLSAGGCVAYYPTKIRFITAAHGWAIPTLSVISWPAAAR